MSTLLIIAITVFRIFRAAQLCLSMDVIGSVIGAMGMLSVFLSVVAYARGKWDTSWSGVVVAVGHFGALALVPVHDPNVVSQVLFWMAFTWQTECRIRLWTKCTIAIPAWQGVEDRGSYSLLRHPMTASEALICISVAIGSPTIYNLSVLVSVLILKYWMVRMEESFLLTFRGYRNYCGRVDYRIVPGVW
jgi:protein-S-isoprenylcysteine O-methyltransferase Ste14